MSRTLAIANIKGGVGKTTTTANLAAALAERGRKVLAIDLDPQASLSLALGIPISTEGQTIREALSVDARPVSTLLIATRENFDLVPASHGLRNLEHDLENGRVHLFALRDALAPVRGRYDYILLDCPASSGVLTGNALAAAD
jgi:chromosome partitioning protein